jgi:hypothetical protein
MKSYYDWDNTDYQDIKYNVVKKQVISHQRYVVYSREIESDEYYMDWKISKTSNAPLPTNKYSRKEFDGDISRNIMIDFLTTTDGKKILEFQIPLSIEYFKNAERMTRVYKIIAHFTDNQRRDYEKYLMIKKLSGD